MDWILARILVVIVGVMALAGVSPPAMAQVVTSGFAPGSVCQIAAGGTASYAELARHPERWNCGEGTVEPQPRGAIRIDLGNWPEDATAPDHLKLRRVHFESVEIISIAPDGNAASRMLGRDDLLPGRNLMEAAIALPELDARPAAIAVIVKGASSFQPFLQAEPVAGSPIEYIAGYEQLLIAMLCGLLLAPIFFDFGFYRTLGAHFPLYHAAFCGLAVVTTATFSGLMLLMTDLTLANQRVLSILSFDFMIAASSLFILSFVERGIFAPFHKRLLWAMAGLTVGLGLFASFALPFLGAVTGTFYYGGYVLYLVGLAIVLARALRGGSRAIRFVIIAHLPLLAIGIMRVAIGLFAPGTIIDSFWLQNFALAFEVIVTSFAVADRFMIIKRERDLARSQARALEELSERDALTGLLNRRALEARFALLRAQGFTTFAVIDLDHFKRVNDRWGHTAGDRVLQCVATALQSGSGDSLAFRMGGEEFVLLLRGEHSFERAENRRLAISDCVDEAFPETVRVTGSMGIVEAPHDALADPSFEALYARADRLLYEAKAAGRDRTISERLQVFRARKQRTRRVAA